MKFKVNNVSGSPELNRIAGELTDKIRSNGNILARSDENADFVLNLIDMDSPKAYRRKSQEEMVISVTLLREPVPDLKSACYVALVKSISNMLFCITMTDGSAYPGACSITPEAGFIVFDYEPDTIYKYMYPVISSHFVLRNRLSDDLSFRENEIIPEVQDLIIFGKELHKLGVLPSPFPLTDFLDKDLTDQLFRLYQIKGLSYGNLSIRNVTCKTGGTSYWMTARGVDKSNLKGIGKDVLLVKGYDRESGEMLVSLPASHDPRIRVSVDAIEHYLIYREFPETGAIVHLHAWMDDILYTTQSYPCGTSELAENVVGLLKKSPAPASTQVGLKNHGITITGPDIRDIFQRINGRLRTSVPMMN
jgi:ribulose-5-phosphate 4-epimerase/fuculose-1-phosphate aldolase